MTTSTASRTTGWLSTSRLLDRRLRRPRRPADRPGGLSPRRRRRAQRADLRREAPRRGRLDRRPDRGADRADARADRRPGHRGVQAGLRRPVRGRPRHRSLPRPDRRREGGRRRRRGPLRQARRERPGLGCAGQAGRHRTRGVRGLLRQRHHRADQRGLARSGLPGHLPGQRGQPRRSGADRRTATTTSASWTPGAARFPAQVHRLSPDADPAGRGRALRHARRDRPDPLPALLAPVRARLPRVPPARVHRVLPAELHPAAAGEG